MGDFLAILDRPELYDPRFPELVSGPLPEPDIAQIELALECRLPDDYREFLLRYGRGIVCLAGAESDVLPGLEALFGQAPGKHYDLLTNHEEFRGRLPGELVPIGETGCDLVCLAVRGENRGRIYSWDPQEDPGWYSGPPPKPDIWSSSRLCARSFAELMDSLSISE